MRAKRHCLVSTPSEKLLSCLGDDSQTDLSTTYCLPTQKRFTRKNNNSQQKKSRSNLDSDQDSNLSISRHLDTSKISQEKGQSFVRFSTELSDSGVRSRINTQATPARSNSFKVDNLRSNRLLKNLPDITPVRISEEKHGGHTSRASGNSIDSRASRGPKSNNVAVLRTQLELKEKELLTLEDERRRFRNTIQDLKRKQYFLQQQQVRNESQIKSIKKNFQQNISDLEKELQRYQIQNKKTHSENEQLKKQLQTNIKQRKIVQKQLSMFVNKQIPKNIQDLQSCRQISLSQTIQQLKQQLNRNKTDVEKQMEQMICRLRQQASQFKDEIKNLQIVNRLLEKRSCDANRYLEAYTTVKAEYKNTRRDLKQIHHQCELLRNQNVKLKKQIRKNKTANNIVKKNDTKQNFFCTKEQPKQRSLTRVPSSPQSLNLSLSNCSAQHF